MGCSRGWTGATVVLAATALAVGAVTPAAAANECAGNDYFCMASSALRNTNAVRAKYGKPALTLGPESLLTNTVGHSKKLADNARGTKDDLVHQTFPDIAAAADCGNALFSAENLYMYGPSPDNGDVTALSVTNLEKSPRHLKNTLSVCDFVTSGVYIDSKKGVWMTQVFGSWTDTTKGRQCSVMHGGETSYGGGNDGGNSAEEATMPTPTYPVPAPRVYPVGAQPLDPVETAVYTPAPSATVLPLGSLCNSDTQCDAAAGAYCRAGWETGAEGGVRARCRTFAAPCAACSSDTMACREGYACTPDAAGAGTCKPVGNTEGRVNCEGPSVEEHTGAGYRGAGSNYGAGAAGSDNRRSYYDGSDRSGSGGHTWSYYVPGGSVYGSGVAPGTYGSAANYIGGGRGARSRGYRTYEELARAASGN